MCGRFVAATDPDGLVRFFTIDERRGEDLPPSYNVAPTDSVPAVAEHDGRRYLVSFRWGLIPPWAESAAVGARMINARAETMATKPAFREAVRRRRCLIAADGFYEWRKTPDGRKVPHYISRSDGAPFAFAGLWETWRDRTNGHTLSVRTCTIVTRAAAAQMQPLHDRMPVALPTDLWDVWLDPATAVDEVEELVRCDPPSLEFRRVSDRVNRVANNDPSLLEPLLEPGDAVPQG